MKTLSQAGLSLLELTIGAALTGILALVGVKLLKNSSTIFSKTVTRLNFQSERDFSFRKIRSEIETSPILRSSLLNCTSSLQANAGSLDLKARGQSLSLAFASTSTIGAVGAAGASTVTVPDSGLFKPGNFIFLESLDQDAVRGLYRVKEIVDAQTLTLDEELMIDNSMGCLLGENTDLSVMLSASMGRKFTVSAVQFAKYSVSSVGLQKFLQTTSGKEVVEFPAIKNFSSLKIDYTFNPDFTGSASGVFTADLFSVYGDVASTGAVFSKKLSLQATYTISQDKVLNQNSNVEALSSNLVFPSCVVTVMSVKNLFAKKCPSGNPTCSDQDEFRNFYKVNVLISEADYFATTKTFPQITVTPVNTGAGVSCWAENRIDPSQYYGRYLLDAEESFDTPISFSMDKSTGKKIIPRMGGEIFTPVICEVPDSASFNGEMKFTVISTSGVKRGLVACTNFIVPKTTNTFVFTKPPSCSKDAAISLGTLTAPDNSEVPEPYLKADGCTWGDGAKNCSIHQVMMGTPDAKLEKLKFYPNNVEYKTTSGAIIDTTITCH